MALRSLRLALLTGGLAAFACGRTNDPAPPLGGAGGGDASADRSIDAPGDVADDADALEASLGVDVNVADVPLDSSGDTTDVATDTRTCSDAAPGLAPACGCALCGNGRIDSCPTEQSANLRESCDGTDLGALSCSEFGYVSGTMGCTPECHPSTRLCEDCATSPVLSACLRPLRAFDVVSAVIATNGVDLGVAWTTQSDVVHFARLGSNLAVISETTLAVNPGQRDIALAPMPGGWLIAVSGDVTVSNLPPIEIHLLDSAGTLLRSRTMEPGRGIVVAPRDGGGPLLAYQRSEEVGDGAATSRINVEWATLLDVDGNPAVAPFPVYAGVSSAEPGVTFVGDGFLASLVVQEGVQFLVRVARIELDGQVQTHATNNTAYSTSLAWNGGAGALLFESGQTMGWQALGRDGVVTGLPVPIATTPTTAQRSPALLPYGPDSIVLRSMYTSSGVARVFVELLRLDAAGTTVLTPTVVARATQFRHLGLARLGNEVFAMWVLDISRDITVARVNPL